MVYNPLAITEPGEPESFAYPSISRNLSLIWEDLDGDIIGPIHASAAEVHIYDPASGRFRKAAGVDEVRIDCYVTDSRFAMVCSNYDKGGGWVGGGAALLLNAGSKLLAAGRSRGKALAGHLRYPWLDSILFQPRYGVLTAETLRLAFNSEGSAMYLQLTLDKSTDTAALAHDLMKRTVAYRKADTHPLDEEEMDALNALLQAGPAPLPEKGTMAAYKLPSSWPAGAAAQYAPPTLPPAPPTTHGAAGTH
ncbi:hypothetical protein [Arthrobacter sp. NPDC057013]|uniref:hypothetical protein n=1 Tax=Arthrobacter sp. NPDC057013 TaxID=3345999 RepID=UPI0036458D60